MLSHDTNLEYARKQHEASICREASRIRQEAMAKLEAKREEIMMAPDTVNMLEIEEMLEQIEERLDALYEEEMAMIMDGFEPYLPPSELPSEPVEFFDDSLVNLEDLPF